MSKVIKSGMFIEGVEVTSAHEGKEVIVTMTDNSLYLPVGFKATIKVVHPDAYEVTDNTGGRFGIDLDQEFEWATPPKPLPKSTPTQRKKLAKAIHVNLNLLLDSIKDAEEVGMEIDLTDVREWVKISFQPPMEEY